MVNYHSLIELSVHLFYFFCVHKFRVFSQLLHIVALKTEELTKTFMKHDITSLNWQLEGQ